MPLTPPRINPFFEYDDGGRSDAGFRGSTGDCVVRAIAIATGVQYRLVYAELAHLLKNYTARHRFPQRTNRSVRDGVPREVYEAYLYARGWVWVPTMHIGRGTTVHLRSDELPTDRGPIICRLSKHMATVKDGQVHDIYDCTRDGTRCVYGYFYHPGNQAA